MHVSREGKQGENVPQPCHREFVVDTDKPHGWFPRLSPIPSDCVPVYRNTGGIVTEEMLTDLHSAIDKCIGHLDKHIEMITLIKRDLAEVKFYYCKHGKQVFDCHVDGCYPF